MEQIILFILYASSFVLTYFNQAQLSKIVSSLLFVYVGLKIWKIYLLPVKKSTVSWALWVSCWFFVLGQVLGSIFPNEWIIFSHLILIGGFSILVLAQQNYFNKLEQSTLAVKGTFLLLISSAIIKACASFFPWTRSTCITIASILWIIGLAFGGSVFLRKQKAS